jgi:hypothetical protein
MRGRRPIVVGAVLFAAGAIGMAVWLWVKRRHLARAAAKAEPEEASAAATEQASAAANAIPKQASAAANAIPEQPPSAKKAQNSGVRSFVDGGRLHVMDAGGSRSRTGVDPPPEAGSDGTSGP